MDKREQPSWTPIAYIVAGIFGFVIAGFAFLAGQFGFFDILIVALSVVAIVLGIRQRKQRGAP